MVLILGIFTGAVSQMVNPFITKYSVSFGADLALAGIVAGVMPVVAMLFRPIAGIASDRLNRKRLMMCSTTVTAVAIIGCMLSKNIISVMIFRMLQGISFSFMGVVNMAFATSFMPEDRIGEGIGYMTLGTVLAYAVGPNIGIWIMENYGYTGCFACAAAVSLLATVFISVMPYKKPVKRDRNEQKQKFSLGNIISTKLIVYAILAALFSMGYSLVNSFLVLFGEERSISNIGLFFTAYSLAILFVRPIAGKLLDKKGLAYLIYPSYIFYVISLIVLGSATSIWMVIVASVFQAVAQGAGLSGVQGYSVKLLGRERAGIASSTLYIGQDLAHSVTPVVGGAIAASFGYGVMYYFGAGIMVMGMFIFAFYQRYLKKAEKKRREALRR